MEIEYLAGMRYVGTVQYVGQTLLLVHRKVLMIQQGFQVLDLLKVRRHVGGDDHFDDQRSKLPALCKVSNVVQASHHPTCSPPCSSWSRCSTHHGALFGRPPRCGNSPTLTDRCTSNLYPTCHVIFGQWSGGDKGTINLSTDLPGNTTL